jgi:DNA-binding IclR family transcriptional regulator
MVFDEAGSASVGERSRPIRPESLAPRTLADRTASRTAIHRDRERGDLLVDQEAELGYRFLAVPWRRMTGGSSAP